MYLFATSFHIHVDHYDEVLLRVREELIVAAHASGIFSGYELAAILLDIEPKTRSFALHLKAESFDEALDWIETTGGKFFEMLSRDFGEKALYFTTPMKLI